MVNQHLAYGATSMTWLYFPIITSFNHVLSNLSFWADSQFHNFLCALGYLKNSNLKLQQYFQFKVLPFLFLQSQWPRLHHEIFFPISSGYLALPVYQKEGNGEFNVSHFTGALVAHSLLIVAVSLVTIGRCTNASSLMEAHV